jgi:hypothetical protein
VAALRLVRVCCEREAVVIISPVGSPPRRNEWGRFAMGRCIGLDVNRTSRKRPFWEKGRVRDAGRVATSPERPREFAETLEATINTVHIERGLVGAFPAGRASGDGTAVGGRPGEGAACILRVVLLASRSSGHPTWWSLVAASDQNEDPVSMADPSIRNDVSAGALLATANAIKGAAPPGRFPVSARRPRCNARTAAAPSAASTAAGGSTPGCPPARRRTGETFT